MTSNALTPEQITAALAEPFPADDVGWKPQATKGGRALAIAYIDARNVMDRLDEVMGVANWQDTYHPQPVGNVICTLSLRIGGEWISKTDIGGPSDQRDSGDKEKAAFSDALKRAAVKWGIGRYLYKLEGAWVEYDEQRKQLKGTPKLPAWALPKPKQGTATPQTNGQPEADEPADPATLRELRKRIEAAGKNEGKAAAWASNNAVTALKDLTEPEAQKLLATLPEAKPAKAGA